MKNNFIIGVCVLLLAGLAVALVVMTITPAVTETTAHTKNSSYDWYFKPRDDGTQPIVADNAPFINNYDVRYLGSPDDKVIYLTFDAGYENGYTSKILDILKAEKAPAAFFVTGNYMDRNPEIIKRMEEEGHLVSNHTVNHINLAKTTDVKKIESELEGIREKFKEITGKEMDKYMRPPEGCYSENLLEVTQKMGYTTIFWSFAYKDWLNDDQPEPQAAIDKILSRTHPGEIALFHSTSATNSQILGDVIKKWKADGYRLERVDKCPKPTVKNT